MKSIKTKIFVVFLSVVILSVGLIILLNVTLFFEYSIYQNKRMFDNIAKDIITFSRSSNDTRLMEHIIRITSDRGIHIEMVSEDGLTLFNLPNLQNGVNRLPKLEQTMKPDDITKEDFDIRVTRNQQGRKQDIQMIIRFNDDRRLIMKKPVGILQENVQVSNYFILMAGGAAIFIGGILVYFLVDRQTKPIKALHRQTERIAALDFGDRFEGKGKDEIAKLGENINNISDALSENINELEKANEQLQSDVDILKEVDQMRKQFIATVSHEFKTPLGIIKSYADGIKYGVADNENEQKHYLDIITDESDRMANMVKDLVQLMKMELNEYKIEKEKISISDFLSQINQRYKGMVEEKSIVLDILEAPNITVFIDHSRIIQVMDNFIGNALHHTPLGGRITIWAEDLSKGIRINVKNTGSYIDEDKLPYIWDYFYRVDKARSRSMGGSGLGLSIVKGIIEAHGGEYGAVNTEDGIIFFFILK